MIQRKRTGEIVSFFGRDVPSTITHGDRVYRLKSASLYRNNWRIVRAVFVRIH